MTAQKNTLRKISARLSFLASLLLFVALGCGDDDNSTTPATSTKVKLATSTTLGRYLTDGEGNTLYLFASDAAGTNTCTGGCATNWPVFHAENLTQELLGDDLTVADFATITANGKQQTTYKGWPLYYFAPNGTREAAGETKGEASAGLWFVAKPDYTILMASGQLVGRDGKKYKGDYTEGESITQYFTDSKGRTLYVFTKDNKNINNYTTGNEANDNVWPVFTDNLNAIPSTLDKTLFGTISVQSKNQLTYKGWPLYYFGADTQRGENKGVSVPTPGVWHVAVKDIAPATDPKPVTPEVVLGSSATFGSYLTDANNNTLYFFSKDVAGANTCTGGCATVWPVYYIESLSQAKIGQGLTLSDFGTITTAGGQQQTTYKGWPLYYYAPGGTREAAGQINGNGIGNTWFVAKPDYTVMLADAQLIGGDGKKYKSDYTEGEGSTQYFINSKGLTLYVFTADKKNTNTFSNGQPTHDMQWPVVVGEVNIVVPSSLDKNLFGSITINPGNQGTRSQLTYKGWPVYYFGSDTKRGDTKGVNNPTPGTWPVVVKNINEPVVP